jgi:hypothetical protein
LEGIFARDILERRPNEVIGTILEKISKAPEEAIKLNKELDHAAGPRDQARNADSRPGRDATTQKGREVIGSGVTGFFESARFIDSIWPRPLVCQSECIPDA